MPAVLSTESVRGENRQNVTSGNFYSYILLKICIILLLLKISEKIQKKICTIPSLYNGSARTEYLQIMVYTVGIYHGTEIHINLFLTGVR